MKVMMAYFSATGNTGKIAEIIKKQFEELGASVDTWDITPLENRQKSLDLSPYDALIFGFPVHSLRAPRVTREWLSLLDGQGKKCSTFFTYGGFWLEPVHYTTQQILDKQNFVLISSAQFLGAHTYNLGGWKAMVNRPDKSDFEVAREYAERTYHRFSGEDPGKIEEFPVPIFSDQEMDAFEQFRFKLLEHPPMRGDSECCLCGLCEEVCPTGAMNTESGTADMEKCIVCLKCMTVCPEDALHIKDLTPSWPHKLANHKLTEDDMRGLQSKYFL